MDVVKVVLFASLYGFYEKRTVVPRWFFLILRVRGAFFSTSPWLWHEKVGESFVGQTRGNLNLNLNLNLNRRDVASYECVACCYMDGRLVIRRARV